MQEKFYMACDSNTDGLKAEYVPFCTSGEAEDNSRRLGWKWVCVYTHHLNAAGAVTSVDTRYFDIAPGVDQLRSVISGVKPMNEDETKFFAQYEKQLNEPPNLFERVKKACLKQTELPPDMEQTDFHDGWSV